MSGAADIEAVVFDIGGTLLDFAKPESWSELQAGIRQSHEYLVRRGVPPPALRRYQRRLLLRLTRAYLWARIRSGEMDTFKQIEIAHNRMGLRLAPDELTELAHCLYKPVRAIAHAHPECPGTLAELSRRGYRLAIISNTIAPPPALDEHLAAEGLLEFFPVRIYSCALGVAKPSPRIFQAALGRLGVAAGRSAYVGDDPRIDVRGARRAGMITVLRAPRNCGPRRGPSPDHRISEITDLLDILPPREAQ